jgi:hypothetical protein
MNGLHGQLETPVNTFVSAIDNYVGLMPQAVVLAVVIALVATIAVVVMS